MLAGSGMRDDAENGRTVALLASFTGLAVPFPVLAPRGLSFDTDAILCLTCELGSQPEKQKGIFFFKVSQKFENRPKCPLETQKKSKIQV
jgi:hypothetical protein